MSAKEKTIGFIGQGFIGKNYADDFERRGYKTVRYALEEPYRANKEKIKDCDYVFIAVPTPTTPDGFSAHIVKDAISLVGKGKVAVVKSTIVPGTTRGFQKEFPDRIVIYSPEFLSEVTATYDAAHPFSNIIGLTEDTPQQKAAAHELHEMLPPSPFSLTCTSTEAEIIKYSHNGSGYTQIIFFNLMYELAKDHGCDWEAIQRAVEADPLINNRYARPVHKSGRGAGGHCFIKDVAAISREYEKRVGDPQGVSVFNAMEGKNIDLLRSSGKDLDLLADVYGKDVLDRPASTVAVEKLRSVHGEMSVLVCTEAIDRTEPLLGFFHRWLEEFARHARRVHVICLGYGEGRLPGNVIEHSLGKESARGSRIGKRILYSLRLLKYAWQARKGYEMVLVHLSPEYLLVAGFLWRILGKRVGFWYNDAHKNLRTRLAIAMSDIVFYTNPHSYAAGFAHAHRIAMGVDTDMYANEGNPAQGSLLFLGRISPAKHLDVLLSALTHLPEAVSLDIVGTPGPGNAEYAEKVRGRFRKLEEAGRVRFQGGIRYDKTPQVYTAHDIFVHLGSLRGFNKTLLEAMSAGAIVVTSEKEMRGVVDDRLFVNELTDEAVAGAIKSALALSEEEKVRERAQLRAYVRREHALSSVVPAMLEVLQQP